MKVGDTVRDRAGVVYRLDREYLDGAQAHAFRAYREGDSGDDPLVVKIYKNAENDRETRLERIIASGPMIVRGLPDRTLCFPFAQVDTPDGDGVVMPHTPLDSVAMSHDDLFEDPFARQYCINHLNRICDGIIPYKMMYLNAFHLARAIDRMYRAGFAHCDFSFNNIFINTKTGQASIIDLDNLAVEGFLTPRVIGTPGFIAPELDSDRTRLPDHTTDAHSLAVIIFFMLLGRHPLVGIKKNPHLEDRLFGSDALFTEHPADRRNTFAPDIGFHYEELPSAIRKLFMQAFVDGLHDPARRPSATQWIDPLWASVDTMVACRHCCQTTPVQSLTHSTIHPPANQCIFCGKALRGPLFALRFSNGQVKALEEGSRLYPHHLLGNAHQYDFSTVLADCKKHCSGEIILANRSARPITAHFRSGNQKSIQQQQGFPLKTTRRIEFSSTVIADVEDLSA